MLKIFPGVLSFNNVLTLGNILFPFDPLCWSRVSKLWHMLLPSLKVWLHQTGDGRVSKKYPQCERCLLFRPRQLQRPDYSPQRSSQGATSGVSHPSIPHTQCSAQAWVAAKTPGGEGQMPFMQGKDPGGTGFSSLFEFGAPWSKFKLIFSQINCHCFLKRSWIIKTSGIDVWGRYRELLGTFTTIPNFRMAVLRVLWRNDSQ